MRSLGTRRAVQVAGAVTVAVIALAGCSAGQTAETSLLETPISGLDTASPDGNLQIRNLQVSYTTPVGYPAGGNAAIEVSLFNQTHNPLTVTITSSAAEGTVSAQQIGLTDRVLPTAGVAPSETPSAAPTPAPAPSGSASVAPSDSASATPSDSASTTPAPSGAKPAEVTIAPLSMVSFMPGGKQTLSAIGLSDRLVPGMALSLTFSTGSSSFDVMAPVAIPLSPASRAPGVSGENSDE
jgi:hypothetical protein